MAQVHQEYVSLLLYLRGLHEPVRLRVYVQPSGTGWEQICCPL